MATRKGSRGPRVHTYVLKVEVETGRVLEAHLEDPITGRRKKLSLKVPRRDAPTAVVFGPGKSSLPGTVGPITRLNLTAPINPPRK